MACYDLGFMQLTGHGVVEPAILEKHSTDQKIVQSLPQGKDEGTTSGWSYVTYTSVFL